MSHIARPAAVAANEGLIVFKSMGVSINLIGGPLDGQRIRVKPDMWHGDARFEATALVIPHEPGPIRSFVKVICTYEMTGEPHTARFREATT